jgi:hypothetical protein
MKITLQLISVFLSITYVNAQTVSPTVIATDGGYSQTVNGSIAWTIGEPVSETYVTTANITTMGFMQPELVMATLVNEEKKSNGIIVFPNPVKDDLKINFSGIENGLYSLELRDVLGKLIYQKEENITADYNHVNIKLTELTVANYFLIVKNKNFNTTIKINKIN